MFYGNLKSICDSKGLNITQVVTECGIALESISKWKNGAYPSSEIIARLAIRLNVSTDLLIFGEKGNVCRKLSNVFAHLESLPENEREKAMLEIEEILKKEFPIDSTKQKRGLENNE